MCMAQVFGASPKDISEFLRLMPGNVSRVDSFGVDVLPSQTKKKIHKDVVRRIFFFL